jgi:hypothetical protein
MKSFGKKLLEWVIAIFVVGAFILGLLFVTSVFEQQKDATTRIEDAVVISKEKVKGGRRSLTKYYLTIQEKDKTEETRVKVDIGAYTWCKEGSIYNDVPGSRGKCENEFNSIEVPEYEPYVFEPPKITYPEISPKPTP